MVNLKMKNKLWCFLALDEDTYQQVRTNSNYKVPDFVHDKLNVFQVNAHINHQLNIEMLNRFG